MTRLLILSNGHGEDLSGALIGRVLKKRGYFVDAIPLVGKGQAYLEAGIQVLGNTREFSTGGLGYTTLRGRLTELFQGQLFYLLVRFWQLLVVVKRYDLLIVVGDVVPVTAAWLSGAKVVTYLVAYSSHYEGKLKLPWPCAYCLSSRRFQAIYSRDQLTAQDLSTQLCRSVFFLGNPFVDYVLVPYPGLPSCDKRLGLLPGSRRPEVESNLLLILRLLEVFIEHHSTLPLPSFDLALVSAVDDILLSELSVNAGWQFKKKGSASLSTELVRGKCRINVHRDSFVQVLQSSDVLLSMAGTATEQAVALSKPVIQLVGYGPQFTSTFAEAQRRLLGPTVFCAPGRVGEEKLFLETAILISELLLRSSKDASLKRNCHLQAISRLGVEGGASRISEAIDQCLAPSLKA